MIKRKKTKANHYWKEQLNPIIGCRNNCKDMYGKPYCYARGIALRFAKQFAKNQGLIEGSPEFDKMVMDLKAFNPVSIPVTFEKQVAKLSKMRTPQRVFVGNMSDISCWSNSTKRKVAIAMQKNDHHTYILLTKRLFDFLKLPGFSDVNLSDVNIVLGFTIDNPCSYNFMDYYFFEEICKRYSNNPRVKVLLNLEPLFGLNSFVINVIKLVDWVILGGQSGQHGTRLNPEWVRNIRDMCTESNTPFFFKQWGGRGKQDVPDIDGKSWLQYPERE